MTFDTSTQATVGHVPFDRMPGFSRLFQEYCGRFEAVARFYRGDPRSPEARREAADRAASVERDRELVADVLEEQNARWGLDDATRANIEALRDPSSVAVVTGQQVGLFTGPAYTIYKTLTTLQLAKQLAEETGRPVVPVFWVEGEDHDFDEIAGTTLLYRNEPVPLRYEGYTPPEQGNPGAVGRLLLGDGIEELVARIDSILPDTDFKPSLLEKVRAAYRPGTSIEDAFTRLMKALFADTGLVYLNPDDARLKELVRPLFRREIEDHAALADRMRSVSEELEEAYHAQVYIRPTNLFLLEEPYDGQVGGRLPIDVDGDRFELRGSAGSGTGRSFTRDELLALLEEAPERFSPNVVLRPLMQDSLLPTAAYVAGPGEIAYFAQYRPAYDWAELPMPVIYPRASATLVESKVQKVLDRYDLTVADFGEDLEKLFRRVVVEAMETDVDALFQQASRHLHQAVNEIKPALEKVDRTLAKSAEATRVALTKEMDRLKDRVVRAEKRQQDAVRGQLEKAHANLYPGGVLQERVLSILYFLNKYSPDLLRDLQGQLSLDTSAHQVVRL